MKRLQSGRRTRVFLSRLAIPILACGVALGCGTTDEPFVIGTSALEDTATPVGENSSTPEFLDAGEADVFVVDVPADGVLSASTSAVPTLDTYGGIFLSLVDCPEAGTFVQDVDFGDRNCGIPLDLDDDGLEAGGSFFVSAVVEPGLHFIAVEGFSPGVSGNYSLIVSFSSFAGPGDPAE